MESTTKNLYEAMFLVDSVEATADWDGINAAIGSILEKSEAEIVSTRKWDERRLAYDVNGKSKGTYILCYFRADGGKVREIERNVQLSERIMRVLILTTEGREQECLEDGKPKEVTVEAEEDKQEDTDKAEVSAVPDVEDQPEEVAADAGEPQPSE